MQLVYNGNAWVKPSRPMEVSDHFHQLVQDASTTHKVSLIKFARVEYNLGLKEAKDLVESLWEIERQS